MSYRERPGSLARNVNPNVHSAVSSSGNLSESPLLCVSSHLEMVRIGFRMPSNSDGRRKMDRANTSIFLSEGKSRR